MASVEDTNRIGAPIFLVGFMGAGKTTVGQALAKRLNCEFFDLDQLIEARVGKPISQIFAEMGEAGFRQLESEAILECRSEKRAVIALGGGAYVSEENRNTLRSIGKTVWLDCPLEICLQRIRGDHSRPLLDDETQMRTLLDQRRPAYAQADRTMRTGDSSPDHLAKEIARMVGE
jgi:shikimate kinase